VDESSDWEVELVADVARRADRVDEAEAWSYIEELIVRQRPGRVLESWVEGVGSMRNRCV